MTQGEMGQVPVWPGWLKGRAGEVKKRESSRDWLTRKLSGTVVKGGVQHERGTDRVARPRRGPSPGKGSWPRGH